MDKDVERARSFAEKWHKDQMYGIRPYIFHLDMVNSYASSYGKEASIVAYLHDVVEDTGCTIRYVKESFGERAAVLVDILTDDISLEYEERKTRANMKFASIDKNDFRATALIVKACDRLSNVESSIKDGVLEKFEKYFKRHFAFKKAAYRKGLCDPIWEKLDLFLKSSPF